MPAALRSIGSPPRTFAPEPPSISRLKPEGPPSVSNARFIAAPMRSGDISATMTKIVFDGPSLGRLS
ncbi:hypothetical protein [Cohnella rhizosphaerae]|uniref:Uncharacterized protein n=1 Tax=Cohnella rhizosphaerae TaxID=1457232 RepID=A0A9X4QSR5_9BACL|nr:hypothetical protein [Cohnella rhizosphaerae]MDG0808857.1 hypothetical protein [Cohnella rhizosphaerae]